MNSMINSLKWPDTGLLPAIAQCADTGQILMLAYMNKESLAATFDEGRAVYFSRSRQSLWRKGESSGHVQQIVSVATDCDKDTILLRVNQTGAACHTGHAHCFFYEANNDQWQDTREEQA